MSESELRFGEFCADREKRLLFRNGVPTALSSKTFDLLEALLLSRGKTLTKQELLDAIWPDLFVEESNLTVQISTLRKVLGEVRGDNRFIVTVPGKGYRFVGETPEPAPAALPLAAAEFRRDTKPGSHTRSRYTWLIFATAIVFVGACAAGVMLLRGRGQRAIYPFGKTQIRQLTKIGNVAYAALSPDGKQFAYVTSELGLRSLHLGRVDGGNDLELRPPSEASYANIQFSPDGNSIYFSISDEANPRAALFRMPVLGGVEEKVRADVSIFVLSPAAGNLAYTRRNETAKADEVYVSDFAGPERLIASFPIPGGFARDSMSYSPDGSHLAIGLSNADDGGKSDLYTLSVADGTLERISYADFTDITRSAWLSDGGGLMIEASDTHEASGVPQYDIWHIDRASGSASKVNTDLSSYSGQIGLAARSMLTIERRQLNNIWIAPADDLQQARQITFGSFGKYEGLWGLDWTPDGRIVFDSSDMQSQVISIMDADGSNKRQLTAPGQVDSSLTVSNDGHYVVFHSTRGGGTDIWRLDLGSGELKQLTFGRNNYQPAVSSDSREVYFKSWENGKGGLKLISIDGGEPATLTQNETSWMSVSRESSYVAALYSTDKARLAIFRKGETEPFKQFDLPKTAVFYVGAKWTPDERSVVYRDSGYGYWQQPLAGGPPTRLTGLPKEALFNFAWSKDGKQFAFVRGTRLSDVVLFTDQN